jgi:hypothetical protein
VYQAPAQNFGRLQSLLVACAQHAGITPPEPPKTMREFNDRFENWLEADKQPIEDQPMMDGFPQTPVEPEAGSSSGLPGDSDGLLTSSDVSPSATS